MKYSVYDAMEAPKCKLCGNRHYGVLCVVPVTIETIKPGDDFSDAIPVKTKFDRNAYQREYMRVRRANKAKLDKMN